MAIAISTTICPTAFSGSVWTFDISTTGAVAAVTGTLTAGALPAGASITTHPTDNTKIRITTGASVLNDDRYENFTIQASDGSTNASQAYTCQIVPILDLSKPLLVIMGDSITAANTGSLVPATDDIKAKIQYLIGSAMDIVRFGYPGNQFPGIMAQYSATSALVYNAARPRNYFLLQGGANDIQVDTNGSNVLTGTTLADRQQTGLNTASATGFRTIAQTIMAWGTTDGVSGVDETLRTDANTVIRGGGFTRDLLCDIGGQTEFNSLSATANTTYYFSDRVHLIAEGNRLWARKVVEILGADSGLPLVSCFDVDSSYTFGASISPVNIPFGGTGAKTWQWKIDGSNVSTSQSPTFTGLTAGTHTITLEVTTSADGTKSSTRTIRINSTGDVGGGTVTPSSNDLVSGGNVSLTANSITSPIWTVIDGASGSISGSGSTVTYTDGGGHTSGAVRASEDMYDSGYPTGGTKNADQTWTISSISSPTSLFKPRLNSVGDKYRFYIPNVFGNNSTIGVAEASTGNQYFIKPDGKVYQTVSAVTTEQDTGNTWTAGDTIDFELVSSSGTKVKVTHNGTVLCTCAGTISQYLYGKIYSEDTIFDNPPPNTTYARPEASGSGVSNWKQGVAAINILVPPVAGFTLNTDVNDEIKAAVTLVITDTSTDADSYEYKITNSAYTSQVVGVTSNPDLTRYLRMGSNTIEQVVTNTVTSDSTSLTFDVTTNVITVTSGVTHDLTGLSSGIALTGYVEAVDNAGNRSTASNTDTLTV